MNFFTVQSLIRRSLEWLDFLSNNIKRTLKKFSENCSWIKHIFSSHSSFITDDLFFAQEWLPLLAGQGGRVYEPRPAPSWPGQGSPAPLMSEWPCQGGEEGGGAGGAGQRLTLPLPPIQRSLQTELQTSQQKLLRPAVFSKVIKKPKPQKPTE